jgi:CelD/BcsL family acetyltransferase involved in cellulose biosynthesis
MRCLPAHGSRFPPGDNRHKQTARNRRRLQRMGTLVFEHSDAPARRQALIEWLFQHKVEQLARSERNSVWLDTYAYRDLLCSIAEPKRSLGCLMTFALVLDGTVLAALTARVASRRLRC